VNGENKKRKEGVEFSAQNKNYAETECVSNLSIRREINKYE